ncbi:MAG: hypothetical protein FWC92_04980 [Defluviitaleaceae bacterium]|nr:hypothetical protein [Defluviitaleaceae bacterium]
MSLYLTLFLIGVGFIVISMLFGEVLDFATTGFFFLKPKVLALVITVIGGVGMILTPRMGSYMAFPFSLAGGLFAGYLLYRLVILPLMRLSHTSTHDKQSLIGSMAKVSLSIPQGGFGKIMYTVNGSFVTSPARTEDGSGIVKDTEVVITSIKNNAYYVTEKSYQEHEHAVPSSEVLNAN